MLIGLEIFILKNYKMLDILILEMFILMLLSNTKEYHCNNLKSCKIGYLCKKGQSNSFYQWL